MNPRSLILVAFVFAAALARLVPHPPNFAPVGAMALFGAAHFRSLGMAFLVPLAAMFFSDALLELAYQCQLLGGWLAGSHGFHAGMGIVYLAVVLITAVGLLLRRKKTIATIGGCVLASAVVFFLVTNFAWWAGYNLYPHTLDGLVQCYVAAIPFFHWTLLGDAFFAAVLFGGFALAEHWYPALRSAGVNTSS